MQIKVEIILIEKSCNVQETKLSSKTEPEEEKASVVLKRTFFVLFLLLL